MVAVYSICRDWAVLRPGAAHFTTAMPTTLGTGGAVWDGDGRRVGCGGLNGKSKTTMGCHTIVCSCNLNSQASSMMVIATTSMSARGRRYSAFVFIPVMGGGR